MYVYIVILKGTNKQLASFELENLWKIYFNEDIKLEQLENTFYVFSSENKIEKDHKIFQRITFTNNFYEQILTADNLENYSKQIKNLDLSKIDNKKFALRVKKVNFEDNNFIFKEYTKSIWSNLKNPQVDLENPQINLLVLHNNLEKNSNKKIRLAIQLFENKKEYLTRMPKLRPIKKPYTLKSDMARAAFNYLNIKEGLVLDPFAGIGGILLEGYDMGFQILANDISKEDLKNLDENFNYFFDKPKYSKTLSDSSKQFLETNSIDGIVTDIPYGKSCRKEGNNLYEEFLKSATKYLKPKKRMVVIYANFLEFKNIAEKYFKIVTEIEEYINKSMTRYILVLENDKSE